MPGAVGSTWEYEVSDSSAKGASVSHITVRIGGIEEVDGQPLLRLEHLKGSSPTENELISIDKRGVLCHRRGAANTQAISIQPPQLLFPADFHIGTKWDAEGDGAHEQFMVAAEEQVRVPAGAFRAYRIECDQPWPVTTKLQRWFAPGVGLVKEITSTRGPSGRLLNRTTLVLTKFSAGGNDSVETNSAVPPSADISAGASPSPTPSVQVKLELASSRDGAAVAEFRSDTPNIFVRWSGENLPVDSTVRLAWIAEDVGDIVEPNFIVDQIERTVTTPDFGGRFTLSRPKDGWAAGRYRLELYLEETLLAKVQVTIRD
jgi:hypothetical protein